MKLPALIGSCLLFFLSGAAAHAQSTTGSTGISLTILPTTGLCRYPLVVNANYSSNLVTNIQPVGILSICSNYNKGFDLKVSSDNNGALVHTQDSSYKFLYTVKGSAASAIPGWDGRGEDLGINNKATLYGPFSPTTTPQNFVKVNGNVLCINNGATKNGCDVGLQWQITTTTPMPEGSYKDTLRYTLAPTP